MTGREGHPRGWTRRDVLRAGAGALGIPALLGCATDAGFPTLGSPRLSARPGAPTRPATPGEGTALGIGGSRDGLLYVPRGYEEPVAAPLLVVLHGATGSARPWEALYPTADARGFVLLVPESRGTTWDAIRAGFGPDVAFLDDALAHAFEHARIDPARVCLAGFSDGASYGLSLGAANGDLFTHLMGWSPGFLVPAERVGRPRVFVSHGTGDGVLPVRLSRERIVPTLRDRGYDVTYREFDGGHVIPAAIVTEALDWFL